MNYILLLLQENNPKELDKYLVCSYGEKNGVLEYMHEKYDLDEKEIDTAFAYLCEGKQWMIAKDCNFILIKHEYMKAVTSANIIQILTSPSLF